MIEDSGTERAESWTPEEIEALFEAAREARLTARWVVETTQETTKRREDAQRRYQRVMAEVQRAYSKGG
jgi:hypothetical protein